MLLRDPAKNMDTMQIAVNGGSGIFNGPMPIKCDANSSGS
jgi:hypothetical protein